MATYNKFHTPLKKRTYIEAFGIEEINTSIFKPTLKLDTSIESKNIIKNLSKLSFIEKTISEENKFEIFYTHLIAKILSKLNICYERYLSE